MRTVNSILFITLFIFNGFSQVNNKIDYLLKSLKTVKQDTEKINILSNLSWELSEINPSKAMLFGQFELQIAIKLSKSYDAAEALSGKKGMLEGYRDIGYIYYNQSNYEMALQNYQKFYDISEELENKVALSSSLNNIGNIYTAQANYPKAIEYYQKSLMVSKEIGDKSGASSCLSNIGNIYTYQADYVKALEYYQKSLNFSEEINDKPGLSTCLNNIGSVHVYQHNYPLAIEYFQKSLKIQEELGDKANISVCLINIGSVYINQGKYLQSIEYTKKGLKINEELGNKAGISVCLANLGNAYEKQGDFYTANEYYKKSLKIKEEINDKNGVNFILTNISILYMNLKKYHEAIEYALKSLNIAKEINSLENIKNAEDVLSESFEKSGNFEKAYEYHKYFKEINDSIYNINSSKQIHEMEAKYQSEKKEKEINNLQKEKILNELVVTKQKNLRNIFILCALLLFIISIGLFALFHIKTKTNKKLMETNSKLITSETALKELNATKDKFFSIITHDLRGPISTLKMYLTHYLENTERFTKEEIKTFTKRIIQSTDNIMYLFENLLVWSKIETNTVICNFEEFYVHEIAKQVLQLFDPRIIQKEIKVKINIPDSAIVYADKNMINFVLRNITDNAIKYTEKGGNIEIAVKDWEKDMVVVSIDDSGVGITTENIKKLFYMSTHYSTEGTENEKGTGLGLILCKEFVEKNNGKIWIESQPGMGSVFYFTLQKAL